MEKSEFYDIVGKLIVPLFTGSHLAGEIDSSSRDMEVALGKSNSILLKPSKTDDYRIVIKRGQAFKSFEVNIIRSIISVLNDISDLHITDRIYLEKLQTMALERALVESLTETGADVIQGIIGGLSKWASRTYEGKTVAIGILVNLGTTSDAPNPVNYEEILSEDFFALFTDGQNSFVEFDRNGRLLGYVTIKNSKKVATVAPNVYEKVARMCNDKRIGICLTEQGDILIFYARQLIFAKRLGNWCVYSHDEIIRLLQNNVSSAAKQVRRAIYNTALDCSFSYKGACIAYIDKDKTADALAHIDAADIICEEYFNLKKQNELDEAGKLYNLGNAKEIIDRFSLSYEEFLDKYNYSKTMAIRRIVAGKKIHELDRTLVEEMTSIDGATIVDYEGTIIAVGAIIKIEAGSQGGGGRLAAAKTLAKYGVAIKVSQDGIMQGFALDKKANSVKQVFYVG